MSFYGRIWTKVFERMLRRLTRRGMTVTITRGNTIRVYEAVREGSKP